MNNGIQSAIIGAVVAAALSFLISQYQRSQNNIQAQTDEQKKAMLDFTQALETLEFDLRKEDYSAFETNADKFDERMSRSEFASFLDYRNNNPPFSGFDKQISTLTEELDNFRRARKSYVSTQKRIGDLLTGSDIPRSEQPKVEAFKDLVVNAVRPPSDYIALWPLERMTEQLRFEMHVRDRLEKEH